MIIKYLLAAVAVYGQSAWLVKDVPGTNAASSTPQGAVRMGNAIYMMTSSTPRPALWKFDLTTRRSSLVREFAGTQVSDTNSLAVVNNRLIFGATESSVSSVWASDGTAAGTIPLATASMDTNDAGRPPVVFGGYMYFSATNGLWRTNGTVAGTGRVLPSTDMFVNGIAEMGGQLYFTGNNRLYRTDGTEAGTAEVAGPSEGIAQVEGLRKLGSKLLFEGYNASTGLELWVSDGTTAGTGLLDIWLGAGSSWPKLLQAQGGFMYFTALAPGTGRELWKTDGTAAGTALVKDINPGTASGFNGVGNEVFAAANGYLFIFGVSGGVSRLIRTDGTEPGTIILATNLPSRISAKEDGSVVFFNFFDGSTGSELWKSDGTIAGTVQVKDICPGSCSSDPFPMRGTASGKSYFRASTPATGAELWETDGTSAGTVLAADLRTGDAGSMPRSMAAYGGAHYYTTTDAYQMVDLWRTDGTAAGTTLVKTIYEGIQPTEIHVVNGLLVFLGVSSQVPRAQLWVSDGTTAGTSVIQNFDSFWGGGVASGNKLFFAVRPNSGPAQLWTSDGTATGTSSSSGAFIDTPIEPTLWAAPLPGGRIVFRSSGGTGDFEPWVSDGTAAGTALLADTIAGTSGNPYNFMSVGAWVFFRSNGRLWKTNGTGALTSFVSAVSMSDLAFALGNEVFFGRGASLWKSDGTSAGTVLVFSGVSPATNSLDSRFYFAELPGKVLFAGQSNASGVELWSTDGTAAGTVLVRDIALGTASSEPRYLRRSGNYVYFAACGVTFYVDCEPWVSDGTLVGTKRVAEIAPGAAVSSNPVMLAAAPGGRMYMAAADPARGSELWLADPVSCAVPLDVTSQLTITAGVPVFNRNSGRFVQNVTIRNNGAAVDGLAYVFGGLNSSVTVSSSHGLTHCASPVGSPYRDIGPIGAGQTVSLALELIAPAGTPLGYVPKVVSAVDGPR